MQVEIQPSPEVKEQPVIKFLTLNTWGLKYVSKFRKQRLIAIADKLLEEDLYDVVALQEIWVTEDWEYMEKILSKVYPYRRRYSSGIITGPGLAILSKYPIDSTFLYRFPINGRPSAFFRGDWYVGKSISVTILSVGTGKVAVMNSHMHAPYSATGDAAYECHRACQAWDFARLASTLKSAGFAVIVVGDLNSKPGSLPFNILTKIGGIKDSWTELAQRKGEKVLLIEEIGQLEPTLQIEKAATTCDSILNSWRQHLPVDKACRLDYVLISEDLLVPIEAEVKFTELVEGIGSYSDHFAYYCQLKLTDQPSKPHYDSNQIKNFKYEKILISEELRSTIEGYQENTVLKFQKNWRLAHVVASIFILIGLHVMIPFTSAVAPWSSVIVLFASTVITIFMVGNCLVLILFLPKEYRALEEVKAEAKDFLDQLGRSLD